MHVKVCLTQYDLIENTEAVLADGQGILNDTTLFYSEKDNPGVRHEIVLEEKHLVIRRIADIVSETDLIIGERSMARVLSPYGVMVLETYTEEYKTEWINHSRYYRFFDYKDRCYLDPCSKKQIIEEISVIDKKLKEEEKQK